MRLLIVEDGATQRVLLEALFQERGSIHLVLASSLAEAKARVADCNFVILDLTLPDATPTQSLEWMGSCQIPTIVHSSTWTREIVAKAAQLGAVGFLTKGTPADQIVTSIHFALACENIAFEKCEQISQGCDELARRLQKRLLRQFNSMDTTRLPIVDEPSD